MKYDIDVFLRKPRKYVESIVVIAQDDDKARLLAAACCNLNEASFSYEIARKEAHPDQFDHIPMPPYRKPELGSEMRP